MNKANLVEKIVARLTNTVSQHIGAARAAHAEATHEESKAEDKYDTRGLEASYLAAGQARLVEESAAALLQFAGLFIPKFGPDDAIDLGALVELEAKGTRSFYFIGPGAGGTEVEVEKKNVMVITPQSPLGGQLVGRKQGERLKIKIGGETNDYRVLAVA